MTFKIAFHFSREMPSKSSQQSPSVNAIKQQKNKLERLSTKSIFMPNPFCVQGHVPNQGIQKGEVSLYCLPPFDWFGISCMTTDNFCFYLQNRLVQTSNTGGQRYTDTSPFSILWPNH